MANPNIPPGPGRPAGIPNKATSHARQAIADFVEGNVERLTGWLDQIAIKDPQKAFDAYMSVVEYHIPRLARAEVQHSGSIELAHTESDDAVLSRFFTQYKQPDKTIQ